MTNELAEKTMSYEEMMDTLKGLVFGTFDRTTSKEREALGSAIDLLSNSDEDCISRAELLKAVDTWDKFGCDADTKLVPVKDCYVPYIHYDDVLKAIKGMPSIQPKSKTEWIPVSERLPEEFQRVLVTIVNYQGDKVVRVAEYYNYKRAFQIKENHEWWEVGEKGLLAWMPLPRAYEPQESDLGDYPDSIHNQFDNMTGSMNL